MPPNTADPISHSSYNSFAPFSRDPAVVPISQTQEGLISEAPPPFPPRGDSAFFLQQLLSFSRDPAVVPIRQTRGPYLFRAKTRVP